MSNLLNVYIYSCMQSSVHIIDAFVTLTPLGLSVIVQVKAVTLSPLRAIPVPEKPRITCPITASIAPMYSAEL
jgi:hypothetical protein